MSDLPSALVAVLGTLAGSTLTFLFQRNTSGQAARFAFRQQLRGERATTYSAFAAALTDFRRSENDRWHLEQADPNSGEFVAARAESYRLRASATAAMCRVRLVCGDISLSHLAQGALDATTEIHEARDERDRAGRGEKARLALDAFVATASTEVSWLPNHP